jgi:hypothetical protein
VLFGGIAAAAASVGALQACSCRFCIAAAVGHLDLGIRRGCPIEKPVDLRVNALTLSKKKKKKKRKMR